MKYLVTITPRATTYSPAVIADILVDTQAWLDERMEDGTVDCAYGFVTGGGVGIVNADSSEELNELLLSAPDFPIGDFDVRPLAEPDTSLRNAIDALHRAAGTVGVRT